MRDHATRRAGRFRTVQRWLGARARTARARACYRLFSMRHYAYRSAVVRRRRRARRASGAGGRGARWLGSRLPWREAVFAACVCARAGAVRIREFRVHCVRVRRARRPRAAAAPCMHTPGRFSSVVTPAPRLHLLALSALYSYWNRLLKTICHRGCVCWATTS